MQFIEKNKIYPIVIILLFIAVDLGKCILYADYIKYTTVAMCLERYYGSIFTIVLSHIWVVFKGYKFKFEDVLYGFALGIERGGIFFANIGKDMAIETKRFCEILGVAILYLSTTLLAGRLRRLERNTILILISAASISMFVFTKSSDSTIFLIKTIFCGIFSALYNIITHVIYIKCAPQILTARFFLKIFGTIIGDSFLGSMTRTFIEANLKKHLFSYSAYIILSVAYNFLEYELFKNEDLDRIFIVKLFILSAWLVYERVIKRFN